MWWPLGSTAPVLMADTSPRARASGSNLPGVAGSPPDPRGPFEPAIDTGRFRFRVIAEDIETLNRRAVGPPERLLDVTALSMHAFAHVTERYVLTACGSSMGDGYGPKVVARREQPVSWLTSDRVRIGVPGVRTTAFLVLRMMLGRDFEYCELPFSDIVPAVLAGAVDAGLVIHEAQLTFADAGLFQLADLGAWWKQQTGLPLPLGANAVRRDLELRLGPDGLHELTALLRRSIEYALTHRAGSLAYARYFAPGIAGDLLERFIDMYVNDLTLDASDRGLAGVRELLGRAARLGISPDAGRVGMLGLRR